MTTILIIEDEEVLLSTLTEKLEYAGYRVIGAENGVLGNELAAQEKPDLILLDLFLPQKSGLEVLEDLKKDPGLKKIPVIVISNSGQPVEIKKVKELGAVDYLIKAEFDPEEVLQKMEKVLGPKAAPKIKPADFSAEPDNREPKPKNSNGKKILVVEDDKFLRDLVVQKLVSMGFKTTEAIDGGEAIKKIEETKPDLIILDLILPDIDGFEILKRLKANAGLARIPVLVLSNLGQQDDVKRARELGAESYMIKAHFTLSEIVLAIQKILEKKT